MVSIICISNLKFQNDVKRGTYFILSGFDTKDIPDDAPDDLEGLDVSAAHVANLLSTEPADSMFLQCLYSRNLCYLSHEGKCENEKF